LLGKKFMVALNAFEVGNRDDYSFAQRFSWFLSLPLLGFGLLAPLGLLGALLSLRELRRYFVPLLFTLVPFATMVLIFVLSRYRLPAVPFLCLFAARAIADLNGLIRNRGWIRLGAWIAALAGISLLVHWPFDRLDVKSWRGAANTAYAGHLAGAGLQDQALEEVELALSMNPDDPLSLNLHARLCFEEGLLSRAEADYRHGMTLYPDDLRWVLQLAGVLARSGQKEALKLLYEETVVQEEGKAIARGKAPPLLGKVFLGLGQLRLEKGNRTAAERAFRKAVRYAPANADAFHTLVLFLAEEEASRAEALAMAEQAAAANPTARALSLLGWVHFMAGHQEKAQALLEQALEKKPQNPLIQSRLKRIRQEGNALRDH
jgi:tetratricopeptide (TPR) repeat protein